jgi:hypothetical protein
VVTRASIPEVIMAVSVLRSTLLALSLCCFVACGGSQPSAEDASSASGGDEASDDQGDESSDDEAKEEEGDKEGDDKAEPKGPDDGPGPVKRSAKDMLTAPETTFMFNFNQSEPYAKADEKCQKQTGGQGKKMADCMKKARSKFGEDGLQFKQEKGTWYYITLRRKGSSLTTLHKVPFEFGQEKETQVVLKTTGPDKGRTPWRNPPREVVVEVPNEFSIAIKDPEQGRLVFDAKIGITSADKAE